MGGNKTYKERKGNSGKIREREKERERERKRERSIIETQLDHTTMRNVTMMVTFAIFTFGKEVSDVSSRLLFQIPEPNCES